MLSHPRLHEVNVQEPARDWLTGDEWHQLSTDLYTRRNMWKTLASEGDIQGIDL